MNLKEVREQFILKSGRYDLITEDGADSGANFFIQAGQRLLDKEGDFSTGQAHNWMDSLKAGSSLFVVPNCWAVQAIWSVHEGAYTLWERVHSLESPTCRFANSTTYSVWPIHSLPSLTDRKAQEVDIPASELSLSATAKLDTIQGVEVHFHPKLSRDTTIKVFGLFYSPPLLADPDHNYWSDWHPETLLKAAMYELEVFYRNSEGAKDWLQAVQTDLTMLSQTQLFSAIQGDLTMGE